MAAQRGHKIRIGFFKLKKRAPARPDKAQDAAALFPDDFQLAHPLKIQIAGQTDGMVIAVSKTDTVRIFFSRACGAAGKRQA